MGRRRELALTLTLSRKRERGQSALFPRSRTLFPLSRLRERVVVRASLVRRRIGAPA